ncbi:MAG: class I SAM-dependent methyltransferase [bacterium]|jgi:SAM-dependent methyltransferase
MTPRDGYDRIAGIYDMFADRTAMDFYTRFGSGFGEVLDIGAGTGRIAIALARKGTRMISVEPSPSMAGQFRSRLDREPDLKSLITLIQSDAGSFDAGRIVPAAFMAGSFDHLLDDGERLKALSNIARHLEPGGRLIFEVWVGLMKDDPGSWAGEHRVGDITYKRRVGRKVMPDGTVRVELVFNVFRGGKLVEKIEQRSRVGISTRDQLHRLLGRAGFEVTGEFGDYEGTPYEEGASILLLESVRSRIM